MNDARLGIVRLPLPDGREVALQLTYRALDARGHEWVLERLRAMQKGKAGAQQALAEALDLMSNGQVTAAEVMDAPVHVYPLGHCLKAVLEAWEVAQYGPSGRPASEAPENPRKRQPTLLKRLFGRR